MPRIARGLAAALLLAAAAACEAGDSRVLAFARSLGVPEPAAAPEATPEPAAPEPSVAAPDPDDGVEVEIIVGGETTSYAAAPAPEPEVPLYGYVDASGSMRMVRGLEKVPPEHRDQARNLSAFAPVNQIDITAPTTVRRRVEWRPPPNPNRYDAILYSSPTCSACAKVEAHLDARGVSYTLREVDDDPEAREEVRRILGHVSVPLLGVDGTWVLGYAPDSINRVLKLDR